MSDAPDPHAVFNQTMAVLGSFYPRFTLTPQTLYAYRIGLSDLAPDLLKAAVLQCGRTLKFFPTVAEIVETAYGLVRQAEGIPDAYEAFGEVICSFALAVRPQWSHPLIGETVETIGGLGTIGMTDEAELGVVRAHFVKAYESLARRRRQDQEMLPAVRQVIDSLAAQYKQIESGEVSDDHV